LKNKLILIVISIIIYTVLVVGITYTITASNNGSTQSSEENENDSQNAAVAEVINEDKSFDEEYNMIPMPEIDLKNAEKTYEIKSLTTEAENVLDLRTLSGHDVAINGENVTDQDSYALNIEEISEENQITINIDGTDYTIRTLPETLANYDYENNGAEDGYYYFSYSSYLVKMSTDGQIAYYNDVGPSYNFKLNKNEDGEVYYTYQVKANANDDIDDIGSTPVKAVVMDENYNVIDEVESIIPNKDVDPNPLDMHEFVFIDVGHYIINAYYRDEVFNIPEDIDHNKFGSNVVASVIQEIKDGEVIFQWKSTDYPELYELSVEHNDYTNEHTRYSDYIHFNALAIDPEDNNLIASFRHLDAVIKLNRDSGEIMWVLGGKGDQFGLEREQKFSRQHSLSYLSDGSILLFNNGNVLPQTAYPKVPEDSSLHDKEEETTIMNIKPDEEEKEVTKYKNYPTGEFAGTRGSVQMLNEEGSIALIGWGSRETKNQLFSEVNLETGEELFKFYPNNEDYVTYRAFKFRE